MSRRKAINVDYEYLLRRDPFDGPWCPICGEIPFFTLKPNSPLWRCPRIIEDVRHDFWGGGCGHPLHWKTGWPPATTNWPKPEDIPEYPEWRIRAARSICWWDFSHTIQSSEYYYLEKNRELSTDQTRTIFGEEVTDFPLDLKSKTLIHFARWGTGFPYEHDKDIPDWAILAMLALAFAWRALRDVFHYHEAEDDPAIVERVRVAESLLDRARLMWAKKDFDDVKPDADFGRKTREKHRAFGKTRQAQQKTEIERRNLQWLAFFRAYRRNHPNASGRECVMKLMEEAHPELKGKTFQPEKQPLYRAMLALVSQKTKQ
jgi:hypothetical protein